MKKKLALVVSFCLLFFMAAPFSVLAASLIRVPYTGVFISQSGNRYPATVDSTGMYPIYFSTGAQSSVELSDTIQFSKGLYYTINYNFVFSKSSLTPSADGVVAILQLSLGNANGYYVSDVHMFASSGDLVVPSVTFLCTEDFTVDRIYLYCSYDEDNLKVTCHYGPDFTYQALTTEEYEAALVAGAIQNQTNQLLSGDSLTAPPGIDDESISDRLDDYKDSEAAIDQAIGGGGFGGTQSQLDSVMQVPSFGPDFTAAFAKINTVFTRVVSTLDLSVALTFMLVFGLALFVIGRRVR